VCSLFFICGASVTASLRLGRQAFYADLSQDALMFIFYYQPGTPQQYYAAKELKRQSWRYHRELQCWLKRSGEPRVRAADDRSLVLSLLSLSLSSLSFLSLSLSLSLFSLFSLSLFSLFSLSLLSSLSLLCSALLYSTLLFSLFAAESSLTRNSR
jgi:hypothetical protein